MTSSQNGSASTRQPSPNGDGALPDKNYLYGNFQNHENWRERLHQRVVHKGLDMAMEDDVEVHAPRTTVNGVGWKELAVAGLLALGGYGLWLRGQPSPAPAPPAFEGPLDSEYEVRFFDADGNPINVPHISQRPNS